MAIHQVTHLLRRSLGGLRKRPWLHLLSIFTLAAAFLSFTATLTAARNLDALLARWVGTAEITVYLEESAGARELEKLSSAVAQIDGVERVEAVTPEEAHARFVADMGSFGDMAEGLSVGAFPASIEVHLSDGMARDQAARRDLAARIGKVDLVGQVEVYDDWFEKLSALSLVGRLASWGLGLLALVVALLVVAATVRAGVFARRKEIEVLKFVGATDRYVRLPFLIQGALEAAVAMAVALIALHFLMNRVDTLAGDIIPLLGGGGIDRLAHTTGALLLAGGFGAGLAGARFSLRGMEEV